MTKLEKEQHPAAKKELGVLLSDIEKAISEVLKPENIYFCKFGEEGSVLHFHVFSRTKGLTSTYLENYPDQRELISGPVLFDWAREFYKIEAGCYSERTSSILKLIRAKLIKA